MDGALWRLTLLLNFFLVPMLVSPGCVRVAQERAELDEDVGEVEAGQIAFRVDGGLASVQRAHAGTLELWAQSPVLEIEADAAPDAHTGWDITLTNAMPDAQLFAGDGDDDFEATATERPDETTVTFDVELTPGETTRLRIAPPDADDPEPYRVAVLSDVQDAVSEIERFWERINEDESLRYVISAGDITQKGTRRELGAFKRTLDELDIPIYTTIGNHEIGPAANGGFQNQYGRANFQFRFKGVYFTWIDSASSTIDPLAYDWLERWLERGKDSTHIFLTHIPPLDPVGTRNGAFRSRNEAQKLLTMLARADVDLGLYGHLHSYYAESNADIPIYISGGGGALPERFDGIGRHYLTVDVAPDDGIREVGVVRVGSE